MYEETKRYLIVSARLSAWVFGIVIVELFFIALLVLSSGCQTAKRPTLPTPPMPPAIKRTKTKAFTVFQPGITNITIEWDDCGEHQSGTEYRIYETKDLGEWVLHATTTNHFLVVPVDKPGVHLFGVKAFLNGIETDFAGKVCR